MRRVYAETAFKVIAYLAFSNFILALVGFYWIGGDAWSGKIENGKYYVCNHGHYTEVTEGVYTYSMIHITSVVVIHVSAFLISTIFERLKK